MTATQPAPDPEQRLLALGLELPPAPAPLAAYVPARRAGNLVFVSGQIPMKDGSLIAPGVVPTDVDPETAVRCAVQCTLNGLAALKAEIGTLSRLRRVVRLGCFVASAAGYHEQFDQRESFSISHFSLLRIGLFLPARASRGNLTLSSDGSANTRVYTAHSARSPVA